LAYPSTSFSWRGNVERSRPMTLEDSIHIQRLRVLREAERLGNVSEACRRHGMSRTLFYRLRGRLEQYGPEGVHPKRRQARRGRPSPLSVQVERRVIAFALAWPTCGPQWFSDQLAREGGHGRPGDRLAAAAAGRFGHPPGAAGRAGAAQRDDDRLAHGADRTRPAAPHPPRRGGGPRRAAVARHVLRRKVEGRGQGLADHRLRCGLVVRVGPRPGRRGDRHSGPDVPARGGAPELSAGRLALGSGVDRPRERIQRGVRRGLRAPRHSRHAHSAPAAWTNGFVERLQKTILHEHWRIAFRRHYFTSRPALQRSLDRFLQFYNYERTHRGHRLRGRTPVTVFGGAMAS
jgi:hypothetical protein